MSLSLVAGFAPAVLLALPAGAPMSRRWADSMAAGLRLLSLAALALGAIGAGEAPILAIAAGLTGVGEGLRRLKGGEVIALGVLLLAEAGWIVLFLRSGGGAAMLRTEPLRLAGVFAAVSAAVFIIRRFTARLGALAGPTTVSTFAVAAASGLSFTLPLARWPAMAGALLLLAGQGTGLAELARPEDPRAEAGRFLGSFWLTFLGAALILLAFRPW